MNRVGVKVGIRGYQTNKEVNLGLNIGLFLPWFISNPNIYMLGLVLYPLQTLLGLKYVHNQPFIPFYTYP